MASAALADDLGYVDCTTHPDATPVYAKARKSQEIVANLPCGEKFKVVLYGFIFSEIQTGDGKVGFVFSNIVTVERGGGTLQSRAGAATTPNLSAASETTKIPADPKTRSAAKRTPGPVTSAGFDAATDPTVRMGGATSVPTQPDATPAPVNTVSAAPANATPVAPTSSTLAPAANTASAAAQPPADVHGTPVNVQPQPVASVPQPQAAPVSAPTTLPDGATVLKQTTGDPAAQASATAAGAGQAPAPDATPAAPVAPSAPAAPAAPALAVPADVPAPATTSNATEPPAPAPAAVAGPAPAPAAEPEPPVVQNTKVKTQSWEKPNYGAKSVAMIEAFGGFAFARTNSGGTSTNLLGGMGSFAWNVKPWIQIVGDTSYNYQTVSGTKNVLYGNHYGARYYLRWRNPWNITPFAEGLIGGSRADTTVSGSGGYSTSTNCISYKVGGGIDMRTTKLFEIRVIDFDYYRTAFGSGVHQNNYWISTGIVLRLFAGKSL